ncbi:MAG: YraN family protein [Magnetococcales bacterium]|nr:YraN family protein [Nitrospirota bacterium]
MTKKLLIGKYGEWVAMCYLKKLGYSIVEKNYKNDVGEIDIIAKEGQTIVFVEVKTRRSDTFGDPVEAITYRKRNKILNTALLYIQGISPEPSVRFDVISVKLTHNQHSPAYHKTLQHIKDAFEL